jgi:DNA-binding CsgD family transcriptional regulator
MNLLSGFLIRTGDLDAADAVLQDCLAIERDSGDVTEAAETRNNLGMVAYWRGTVEPARRYFEQAIDLSTELGLEYTLAQATFNLGLLDYLTGDTTIARQRCLQSVGTLRHLGDLPGTALSLGVLGCIGIDDGNVDEAAVYLREGFEMSRDLGDKVNILFGLEAFAQLETRRGNYRGAFRLAAAASALREAFGVITFSLWQSHLDLALDLARRILGSETSAAIWAEGSALTLTQAVELALTPPAADNSVRSPAASILSRREWEVARLVASGLLNKEVALKLRIQPRTAESHLQSVMNKLGLNSRTQVTAWVIEHSADNSAC